MLRQFKSSELQLLPLKILEELVLSVSTTDQLASPKLIVESVHQQMPLEPTLRQPDPLLCEQIRLWSKANLSSEGGSCVNSFVASGHRLQAPICPHKQVSHLRLRASLRLTH